MTTIFTDTLVPQTDGGNAGFSFRDVLTITGASLGQVRVTLILGGGGPAINLDHVAIGISTGTSSNTTATPVELTFSGASGITGNALTSTTYVSDWVNLSGFTSSDKLVVITDFNATNGGGNYATDQSNANGTLYGLAGASYNNATPTPSFGPVANYSMVALVETQAAGGSPALIAPLTGRGIPRLPLTKPRFPIVLGTAYVPPVIQPTLVPAPVTHGIRRLALRKTLPPLTPAAFALPTSPNVPTLVQAVGSTLNDNNGISGNAFQFNMPNLTLAGNCLVLQIAYPYNASRTISISDSTGDTWPAAAITQGTASTGNMRISLYVLPNASAGLHTLTITFDASLKPFKYVLSEFNNIATSSPVDGTTGASSVSGSAANAGSFTPTTNNDANGGHLIVGMAISNDTVGTLLANQASAISAANSAQFIDADNTCTIPSASSYLLQATNGAINPGFAFTQSTPTNFVVAALALKTASAGQARPAGIRIVRILHISVVNPQIGDNTAIFPCDGNLRVVSMAPGNNINQVNSVKDSNNTSGYTDRTFTAGVSQVFESANTVANNTNALTLNLGSPDPQFSAHLIDIIGADTAPFMNTSGFNGAAPGSGTVFNDFPDHTPNANVAGLTIVQTGMGTAGPQFGFASGAPSGAIFDNVYYTGMTDQDRMDNADPFGHAYFSGNTAQTWNWLLGSAGWGSTAFATAISYKAAAVTAVTVNLTGASAASGVGTFLATVAPALSGASMSSGAGSFSIGEIFGLIGIGGSSAAGSFAETDSDLLPGAVAAGGAGTFAPAEADALAGASASGAAGSFTNAITGSLVGASATSAAGTISAGNGTFVNLTGAAASIGAGALGVAEADLLPGAAASSAAGSFAYTITGILIGAGAAGAAGTFADAISLNLPGASASSGAGVFVEAESEPLPGAGASGSAGTFADAVTKALSGASASASAGTLSSSTSSGGTVSLPGAAAVSAAGGFSNAISVAIPGASAAASAAAFAEVVSAAIAGVAANALAGSFAPSISRAIVGASGTFSAGSFGSAEIVSLTGAQTAALAGLIMASYSGQLGLPGASAQARAGILTVTHAAGGRREPTVLLF